MVAELIGDFGCRFVLFFAFSVLFFRFLVCVGLVVFRRCVLLRALVRCVVMWVSGLCLFFSVILSHLASV